MLKPAIVVMAQYDRLDHVDALEQEDWNNLKCIKEVLEPFQVAQRSLDGDKYITSSWVLRAIRNCRAQLTKMSEATEEESASNIYGGEYAGVPTSQTCILLILD